MRVCACAFWRVRGYLYALARVHPHGGVLVCRMAVCPSGPCARLPSEREAGRRGWAGAGEGDGEGAGIRERVKEVGGEIER